MKMHAHSTEGPPCSHMEGFLQATADGTSRGLVRWYAKAHAARCMRCGAYLERMSETVEKLHEAKSLEPGPEALRRLSAQLGSADEEPTRG